MRNTIKDRFQYHPDPVRVLSGNLGRESLRRVDARKDAILRSVDLKDKALLDLGCSGGYFGFSLADIIKSYHGLDADCELITRNTETAQNNRLHHIKFEHSQITPERVHQLPQFDVAFFLSVYHHILAVSKAYEWNQVNTWEAKDILVALAEKVKVLIFETGYPDEGHEWCEHLPPMLPTPRAWVEQQLCEAGFKQVEVIPAPAYQSVRGGIREYVAKKINLKSSNRTLLSRVVSRILRFDSRDGRDIFIARHAPVS